MDAQPFSHFPPFSSSPEPLTSDNSEDSSDAFESETSDLSPTVADPVIAHAVADLFPPEPCGSTLSQVRAGCTFHRARRKSTWKQLLLGRLPLQWRETELPSKSHRKYDKAFTCEWLSDQVVVIGTKCNRLLCLDVATGSVTEIPLPIAQAQPQSSSPVPFSAPRYGNCGIHAIAVSPDQRLLATGGFDPAHCQVFEFDIASDGSNRVTFRPAQTLVGHQDWIFGINWVTDRHLVTGSRDRTAKLWHVDKHDLVPCFMPLASQVEKDSKVRDVKYHQDTCRLLTLTTSGFVRIWDPHLNPMGEMCVGHDREVVCMAVCQQLVAVGTQSHVTLLDPRCKLPACDIRSRDPHHGVRSVSFQGHILTSGSGRGHLAFYDLRAARYLNLGPDPQQTADVSEAACCSDREHLQLGRGWLVEDSIYWEHFNNMQIANACYAHAWDPTNTKLMTVGGPLPYGLRGCYMGLWD